MRPLRLLAVALVAVSAVSASETVVNMCSEHHGWAGEASANFTLNAAGWSLAPDQRYVLYARSLSAEGSVQLSIAGRMFPADEPLVTDNLPPPPFAVHVLGKNMDLAPFSFVSYVANSDDCRLPLTSATLPIPLKVIDDKPAVAYFYAAPVSPYTFFTISISGSQPVTAVYRYNLQTPLDQGIPIPMDQPVGGQTDNMNSGVYVAAKAAGGDVDLARFSITWSVPPAGWTAPTAPAQGGSFSSDAALAAREGGSFFASFFVTLFFGFGAYLVIRSVYNYHQLGIRQWPEYVPHHEVFAAIFAAVVHKVEDLRNRTSVVSPAQAGVGPLSGADHHSAPAAGSPTGGPATMRRGYESVGGGSVQP